MKRLFCTLAFARLAVVKPSEGLVFGDVGVEELEWVLWDNPVRDHFVVSYDVREWESAEPVFSVWFHRVELHISWQNKSEDSFRSSEGNIPEVHFEIF